MKIKIFSAAVILVAIWFGFGSTSIKHSQSDVTAVIETTNSVTEVGSDGTMVTVQLVEGE